MEERREYDVLKIVRHSDRCYLSSDRVRGMPLVWWLKYHTLITGEQAFLWIGELIEELSCFHQTRENPCYQYLNPYSIIVGENERWYLLDLSSEGQKEMLHLMQRRMVREQFLPPDNQYYQKSSVKGDLYGVGKIIQYLLSVAAIEPKIRRSDERRLQVLISRCLDQDTKKAFRDMTELSEQFSKIYPPTEKKNNSKWLIVSLLVVLGLSAAFFGKRVLQRQAEDRARKQSSLSDEQTESETEYIKELIEENESVKREKDQIEENALEREKELLYELIFFNLKLENYRQCRVYLEGLTDRDSFAKELDQLCCYLGSETELPSESELELLLARMEEEIPDRNDRRFDYCLLKGFLLFSDENENEEIRHLAETCISSSEWIEWAGEELVQELTEMSQVQESEETEVEDSSVETSDTEQEEMTEQTEEE